MGDLRGNLGQIFSGIWLRKKLLCCRWPFDFLLMVKRVDKMIARVGFLELIRDK